MSRTSYSYAAAVLMAFCIVELVAANSLGEESKVDNSTIILSANSFAKAGEVFLVDVSLSPPSKSREIITLDPTWGLSYSRSTLTIGSGGRVSVAATVKKSISGLAWVHASAPGYDDSWVGIVVDFDGGLKLSSTSTLSYESPTTLTVTMIDKGGKPLRLPSSLELHLTSADGLLSTGDSKWQNAISVPMTGGGQSSPQFQIKPTLVQGGAVDLSGTLVIPHQTQILTQEDFKLTTEPAIWLTILLAVGGGLVHGLYKTTRLFEDPTSTLSARKALAILAVSGVAGLIGYFFAHLDLLGLKIDPNVLRSYPLIGFLFSYVGFEVLLPKSWSGKGSTPETAAEHANPNA